MNNNSLTDLDQTLDIISAIQEDLNYQQAQASLTAIVEQIDLDTREKQGLEREIGHLCAMLENLNQGLVQIAAFGLVGRGKSSLLNALLGEQVFTTGPIHGVTQSHQSAPWQLTQADGLSTVTISGWGNAQLQLIDTPGIDEVKGKEREQLAIAVAQQVDLILFVIAGDISQVEFQALSQLRAVGKPMLLVFNKIDQYPATDQQLIYEKIRDERVKELLSPEEIILVSASPLVTALRENAQGKLERYQYRGEAKVDNLRLKIIDLLQREGKSLVALNTLLCADSLNDKLVQQKMRLRDSQANSIIQKAVMVKAAAIALNPVTVLDLFSGAVVDVALIISLSKLYGLPMTQTTAIALLQKIGVSMGGITASEFLAGLGLSSLKGLLGLTVPLTGGLALAPYISVALTQASVAGVSTLAIGQVTKTYLANGAAWGETGPRTVVRDILNSLDQNSVMARIKQELQGKLTPERIVSPSS
ncbi:GTP-binding protein [Synechocystis sp. LEGE 06083]|uniref:GTP-binding protein n=1 Tax=Synechocystis sp. LEGE 06083 TaxID=915336 RepID=UPI00187F4CC2|nr:GTP-binding protein [Synechocystis sp. LEGE 06083]MBE9195176.1 GTP-binding protein [Synechocystis sp. LEGE 06083]